MKNAKKYSKNDLSKLYDSCPIFKKYCQFNLWSEEFDEYGKVKYCETYLHKYIYAFTQRHLLQCFSPSFLGILHTSPPFIKFMKSGFIKYIDFHFLLFFQANSFHYSTSSVDDIEAFVEGYFQKYSRKVFEEDLFKCLLTSINELVPQSLQGFLDSRLTFFYKQIPSTYSINNYYALAEKDPVVSKKACFLICGEDKNILNDFYFSGSPTTSSLVLAENFFKSFLKASNKTDTCLQISGDPLSVRFPDFFNIILADTTSGWGLYFGEAKKDSIKINPVIFIESFFVFNYFYKLSDQSTIIYILSRGYKWCFYTFLASTYKPTNRLLSFERRSKVAKTDVHALLEVFIKDFDTFVTEENDIETPVHKTRTYRVTFESDSLGSPFSNFENLLKGFDSSFSRDSNKNKIKIPDFLFSSFDKTIKDASLSFMGHLITIFARLTTESYSSISRLKKQFVFLTFSCSEKKVNEWGLYTLGYVGIVKVWGFYRGGPFFFLEKNSNVYRYFFTSSKKNCWESSYLLDSHYTWVYL